MQNRPHLDLRKFRNVRGLDKFALCGKCRHLERGAGFQLLAFDILPTLLRAASFLETRTKNSVGAEARLRTLW